MSFFNNTIYKIGSYEIYFDIILGSGNYSNVYLGKCTNIDIINKYNISKTAYISNKRESGIVAIKKIKINELSSKTKKAILTEIDIMNEIKENPHPNIVSCYDIIDDIDTKYIILEYCECGDFSNLIGKPMKEESVRYYLKQLIDGMKYLDDEKIIHRDIKPKNLLLTDNKKILKICDFGLAKKTEMSRIHTMCGSPLYMAPEIFRDKSYDKSSNLWPLGMIMYEMLFGENPFRGINDFKVLEAHLLNEKNNIKIPPENNKNKNISNDCLDLLRKLLEKNIEKRISLDDLYDHPWIKNPNNIIHSIKLNKTIKPKKVNKNIPIPINKNSKNNLKNIFHNISSFEKNNKNINSIDNNNNDDTNDYDDNNLLFDYDNDN
jgi:Serine/threonine protein kinase